MAQSVYAALNGSEIRNIIKNKLIQEIDKIPYLKLGNSFHRAELEFGFTMKAYPADCPVPEKTFTIVADSGTINSPDAIRQITKAEELESQLEAIRKEIARFEQILTAGEECLATIRNDHEKLYLVGSSQPPDQVRIDNDLPVPVTEMKDGKRIETTLPAGFFKKETNNSESVSK